MRDSGGGFHVFSRGQEAGVLTLDSTASGTERYLYVTPQEMYELRVWEYRAEIHRGEMGRVGYLAVGSGLGPLDEGGRQPDGVDVDCRCVQLATDRKVRVCHGGLDGLRADWTGHHEARELFISTLPEPTTYAASVERYARLEAYDLQHPRPEEAYMGKGLGLALYLALMSFHARHLHSVFVPGLCEGATTMAAWRVWQSLSVHPEIRWVRCDSGSKQPPALYLDKPIGSPQCTSSDDLQVGASRLRARRQRGTDRYGRLFSRG